MEGYIARAARVEEIERKANPKHSSACPYFGFVEEHLRNCFVTPMDAMDCPIHPQTYEHCPIYLRKTKKHVEILSRL